MAYLNGKKILNAKVEIVAGGEGYDEGYIEGHKDGVADGKQVERTAFWDAYQQNGERTNYTYAFYGTGWTDDNYNPIYPIKPLQCNGMYNVSRITDTKVDIDLTAVTGNSQAFAWATRLVTIRKVIFAADVPVDSNCFEGCSQLQNITVTGELGCNMKFGDCTQLTAESMYSIVMHLQTYNQSSDKYGKNTLTVSSQAWQRLVDSDLMDVVISTSWHTWESFVAFIGWNLVLT